MCIDMCSGVYTDMSMHTIMGMPMDMPMDMCTDMCTDIHMDMCVNLDTTTTTTAAACRQHCRRHHRHSCRLPQSLIPAVSNNPVPYLRDFSLSHTTIVKKKRLYVLQHVIKSQPPSNCCKLNARLTVETTATKSAHLTPFSPKWTEKGVGMTGGRGERLASGRAQLFADATFSLNDLLICSHDTI